MGRTESFRVRVSNDELLLLKSKSEKAGCNSVSQYIRKMAIQEDPIFKWVDFSNIESLIYELNKIGTNINQVAYKCNSTNEVHDSDINALKNEVKLMKKLIIKYTKKNV